MNTLALIVSDIHLGSRYCRVAEFLRFMDDLPPGADLVLNGDVVDRWHHAIPDEHKPVLEAIRRESLNRRVVWVRGNHDDGFVLKDPRKVEFADSYELGSRLFASHGYDFDNVMPYHETFIKLFRAMHHLRILLGAEPVHVAYYAKKFAPLYNVLRRHVTMNAIEHGRENGFEVVTCGHTHYVEEVAQDGVRYINTGSWTEKPICCVEVGEKEIGLREIKR